METMMEHEGSKDLLRLIDSLCDDLADGDAVRRIDEIVASDPGAAGCLVDYLDMHATLRWMSLDSRTEEHLQFKTPVEFERLPLGWRLASSINRHGMLVLAASVLLCVLSFSAGRWGDSLTLSSAEGGDGLDSSSDSCLARITGLVDCKWAAKQDLFSFGQPIRSGQEINIAEGLVQVTFGSGAKVVIQGPARFTPQTSMHAQLTSGKVSAIVPEPARGYTVTTPTAEIVDLGTEFGVDVDAAGATEVHVLDGDVVARARQSNGELRGEAVHARKEDALRFISGRESVMRLKASPERFARQITPKLTPSELPPIPVTNDLEFWVAADLLVSRDALGRVSAWRDICIGDNQRANDACQFVAENQPLWVEDAGRTQPAIRFNGTSTRLFTDAIDTGNRITLYVACAPSEYGQNATRWGGQLFNFGGEAPTVELAVHHDQVVYSGLWAANAVGVKLISGEVRSKRVLAGPRYLLAYSYDMKSDCAELWVNGQSQGTSKASLSPRIYGPRTIGGHGYHDNDAAFFHGDIFEILLYDRALDEEEQLQMTDYLCDRYRIDRSGH